MFFAFSRALPPSQTPEYLDATSVYIRELPPQIRKFVLAIDSGVQFARQLEKDGVQGISDQDSSAIRRLTCLMPMDWEMFHAIASRILLV